MVVPANYTGGAPFAGAPGRHLCRLANVRMGRTRLQRRLLQAPPYPVRQYSAPALAAIVGIVALTTTFVAVRAIIRILPAAQSTRDYSFNDSEYRTFAFASRDGSMANGFAGVSRAAWKR
jgi:hypothetical protein